MTKYRSSLILLLFLAGCATPSGLPAADIAPPGIAAAYLPLQGRVHLGLDGAAGAAMAIAPGVAVTNGHNRNLLDPATVIGVARDYDLLFFRDNRPFAAVTAEPVAGEAVTAYGQDTDGALRVAHGVVRDIATCPGCIAPAYFTFSNDKRGAGDAGPGFSGGPVIDGQGRLVGITFGYQDETGQRLIYAYDMARVRTEFSALQKSPAPGAN